MATRNLTVKMQMRRDTAANWEIGNPILAAGEIGYDTTNKRTKIGDGTTAWKNLSTFTTTDFGFASASWREIGEIAAAGAAGRCFSVGDKKTITLSTGEAVTIVILGFNHDDLTAGGKAPITLGMENLLATTYRMNSIDTNVGGWHDSMMRNSTMEMLLFHLPADLSAEIKQVNKKSLAGNGTTSTTTSEDRLFLFSDIEISNNKNFPFLNEGAQYEYWRMKNNSNPKGSAIKKLSNGGGFVCEWWLRTIDENSRYCRLVTKGGNCNGVAEATSTLGVSFGFCI